MTRSAGSPPRQADVVVVGAGIVGAACAYYLAAAGLGVCVLDRGPVAGGTTGGGEGNLLASDKAPGPELDLILRSLQLWRELGEVLGADTIELEPKGGLVVAASAAGLDGLRELAASQRQLGVTAIEVVADDLTGHEPALAPGLAGGVYYPQDMQVQPMLAATHLLRTALRRPNVRFHRATVTGLHRGRDGRLAAVQTDAGPVATAAVVNASGTWAGELSARFGAPVPISPRRGFILVTEPLPPTVRHKVYAAEYVANIASDATDAQTSAVVEATRAGTVLIGASRERVGFDDRFALPVLRRLAAQAVALFPVLAGVHAIRTYRGFRPYSPDHLPVIGPDPRVPGLLHACGHEGAGIGLAPATGELIASFLTGAAPAVDPEPLRPGRFAAVVG
ncbi:MAG: NAD(P)/FAD-dependent oxidoreductase [Micromonosporaceae bacterium]